MKHYVSFLGSLLPMFTKTFPLVKYWLRLQDKYLQKSEINLYKTVRFPSKQVARAVCTLGSGLRREATLTHCIPCYDVSFILCCLHFPDSLRALSPISVPQPGPGLGGKATSRPCPTAHIPSRGYFVTPLSYRQKRPKFVKTEEYKTRAICECWSLSTS